MCSWGKNWIVIDKTNQLGGYRKGYQLVYNFFAQATSKKMMSIQKK